MYQITQLKGKNSPVSHAKRQRWPRRRAPQAASEPTASQTAAARPSVHMPAALTPQHYRARAGGAAPEHSSKSRQTFQRALERALDLAEPGGVLSTTR